MECLRALERERQSGILFDVVVVDDGSSDATAEEVERLQSVLTTPIRFLRQENKGPAAARNRGVKAAQGDLILFLGDDIIVEPGYVDAIHDVYKRHEGEICGVLGHTRYDPCSIPTPFGRWLDGQSGLQFAYNKAKVGVPLGFDLFYTSNVLVPRDALLRAGGFNEGFRYAAFEDTELGYRLMKQGLKLYYARHARAYHVHPISIESVAARMQMTAKAALQLRSLNPELFDLLYPRAESRFARPGWHHRLVRWTLSGPVLALLTAVDRLLHVRMPGVLYGRVLYCVQTRAIARLWSQQEA